MRTLTIRHNTVYRYKRPVTFGEHRLMLRPRDSHDLRLISADLILSPRASVRWIHDVFGNSVAVVIFAEPAAELKVESKLVIERYALDAPRFELDDNAHNYPFIYSADDRTDLGRTLERHYPDPKGQLEAWAQGFIASRPTDTLALLADINATIKDAFTYNTRWEEGTQTPLETLELGSGTCRDFALLFIEALRSLGFAARFVTGYLYDPALDGAADSEIKGAGATHAWAEVYLPGAGWIEYDPTNGIIAGENLIRIAVTRDPHQAVPVGGSFDGTPEDGDGMTVEVEVTSAGRSARRAAA
ncbi:transglutaminase [Agaricicola taiwanensis]|uniref:Transglutaminase n=1 Tax=Agaricicola taiwanensis TaxID=591372 RepID=A0A8J2VZ69_9RHOB|nr:transglutaminase family protein [Agaricicola taiwanensis]GGE39458.1 transglutaminase [Agaricicola taiwanensis]